jgi:predicted DNA-binding protein
MSTVLHPQYITDEAGKRVSVSLPIEEYEALIERLEDLADAREVLDRLNQGVEQTIPWDDIKGKYGLEQSRKAHG